MLKNKYDLTLCQSRLHTASETFVRQTKIRISFDFLRFHNIACILIGRDGEYENKTEKRMLKFHNSCAMTLNTWKSPVISLSYNSKKFNIFNITLGM